MSFRLLSPLLVVKSFGRVTNKPDMRFKVKFNTLEAEISIHRLWRHDGGVIDGPTPNCFSELILSRSKLDPTASQQVMLRPSTYRGLSGCEQWLVSKVV